MLEAHASTPGLAVSEWACSEQGSVRERMLWTGGESTVN